MATTEINIRREQFRSGTIVAEIISSPFLQADMFRRGVRVQAAAKRNIQQMGAIDTGRLLNSIDVNQTPLDDQLFTTVGSDLEYAIYVHDGRKPGGRMPPVQAIERWARRQGMSPGAGFPIARSIARRGIKGRPFLQKALPAAKD